VTEQPNTDAAIADPPVAASSPPPHFDHGAHPRHTGSGQFVSRQDVHQAMNRIDGGSQGRANLPAAVEMNHPNNTTQSGGQQDA
jgi:hypothetical protein